VNYGSSNSSSNAHFDRVFIETILVMNAIFVIGLNVVDWIGLAQDRYRWRALIKSVMNLRVP
jgi:hypothetical protein